MIEKKLYMYHLNVVSLSSLSLTNQHHRLKIFVSILKNKSLRLIDLLHSRSIFRFAF